MSRAVFNQIADGMREAIATTDAPKGKGSEAVASAAPIQDFAMLNVAEAPALGKPDTSAFHASSATHKAAIWLDGQIAKAGKGVTTQVVELTPELATVLLERNPKNRKISQNAVENFARDIEHAKWRLNGEPIIISDDGQLNDGQHRCTAVILADMPITTTLVIGVHRDSRTTLDQGRARTVGDYLSMDGYVNSNELGSAAAMVWQHELRGYLAAGGTGKPTKGEIIEIVDQRPAIVQSVQRVRVKGAAAYGGVSMLAFCHYTFLQAAGREVADDFIEKLVGGAGLLARDPILYLRNRLVNERGRLRPNDKAELIFRAWNAWRRREVPRVLPILGGVLPVVEK